MLPQNHDLDMTPNGVPIVVNVSQYDVGREINFYLYNGSEVYTPAVGALIRIEGTKPDNTGFSYIATFIGNKVTMILREQMTVLEGAIRCELRVTEGGSDVGSLNFILQVEKAALRSDIPISDTEIPAIIELARAEQYNAEAWAVGQRNGQDVPPTDPTYHNNAKYWSENAQHGSLDALADVEITTPSDGQALLYDAANDEWINGNVSTADSLGDLTDVTIATPSAGQVLTYDDNDNEWKNADIPTQSVGVEDLDDATITLLADGDILRYSSADSEWQNSDALSVAEGAIAQNASDIDDIDDEISAICNVYGSKNLLNNEMTDGTSNTIVFTVNADKSFSTSAGTPSGNINDKYIANGVLFKAGTYRFSGFPDGTNTDVSKVFLEIKTSWAGSQIAVLNANTLQTTFTLAEDTILYIRPYFISGTTLPAMTFKPMITDARIKDTTYVPYAPTNRDCMSYAVNTKLGAHNILGCTGTTQTLADVTFSVDSEGIVTTSGTSTQVAPSNRSVFQYNSRLVLDASKTYRLSGCPAGGGSTTYDVLINFNDSQGQYISNVGDEGNGVLFTPPSNASYAVVYVRCYRGVNVTGKVFKPMITFAEDTDPTYAPYTMTNMELTEKKQYNVTTSITSSNATVQVAFIANRKGTMVNLYGYVQANTSITAGANITGTFSGMPKPLWTCTSATFSATMTFCANLGSDGAFTVRVPANILSGQSIFLNFTYATEDLI